MRRRPTISELWIVPRARSPEPLEPSSPEPSMSEHLKPILEALIFASPEPLTLKEASTLLADEATPDEVANAAHAPQGRLRPARGASARRGRRWLSDRHAARAARVRAAPFQRAHVAEAVCPGARNAGGHRLPTAGDRPGDRGDPRREHVGRAEHAHRPQAREDRRAQAGSGPPVHVRHDAGVPRKVRAQRPLRSPQGRGPGRGAGLRSAGRSARWRQPSRRWPSISATAWKRRANARKKPRARRTRSTGRRAPNTSEGDGSPPRIRGGGSRPLFHCRSRTSARTRSTTSAIDRWVVSRCTASGAIVSGDVRRPRSIASRSSRAVDTAARVDPCP